jgi:glycosyltransferase involved in cell wall biosynthesis
MKTKNDKPVLLVLGQTPPPYGGQAIMIDNFVSKKYESFEIILIRFSFSREMDEIGTIRISKLFHALRIVYMLFRIRFNTSTTIDSVYYPPAGGHVVPIIRDMMLLVFTRLLFRKIIFHMHAGGIGEVYKRSNRLMQSIMRFCYFRPDLTINVSRSPLRDAEVIKSKRVVVIENGIKLSKVSNTRKNIKSKSTMDIVFIGLISKEKGVTDLLNALSLLEDREHIRVHLVGEVKSSAYRQELELLIDEADLKKIVVFHGVLVGEEKQQILKNADLFCLPSHFETFGLVLLEAMEFRLPVIATRLGPIREIVSDKNSGLLCNINDPVDLKEKIEMLISSPRARKSMGLMGRNILLDRFSLDVFQKNMEAAISQHIFGLSV